MRNTSAYSIISPRVTADYTYIWYYHPQTKITYWQVPKYSPVEEKNVAYYQVPKYFPVEEKYVAMGSKPHKSDLRKFGKRTIFTNSGTPTNKLRITRLAL